MTDEKPQVPDEFEYDGERFPMLTEDDLMLAESRAIEKAIGANLDQLGEPGYGSTAMQALLWVSIKRRRPTLKFRDLDEVPLAAFRFFARDAADAEEEVDGEAVDPSRPVGQDATPERAAPAAG